MKKAPRAAIPGRGRRASKAIGMGSEFAVNAAIHKLMRKHELTARDVANLLYISRETVLSWGRSKPTRAPRSALALLCYRLNISPPQGVL